MLVRRQVIEAQEERDGKRMATLQAWRRLLNMNAKELRGFLASHGAEAGLSRSEAAAQGIRSGRDSARAILRMLDKVGARRPRDVSFERAREHWTPRDWDWAERQVRFVRRMQGTARATEARSGSAYYRDSGAPTRLLLALNLWGHKPGGRIAR